MTRSLDFKDRKDLREFVDSLVISDSKDLKAIAVEC